MTLPSGAEKITDSPLVCAVLLQLNTIKRGQFDYTVKAMVISQAMSILGFILSVAEI